MSTTASQPPIPPRPSRSTEKQAAPMVPPRPLKNRIERSMSPNPNRFAPSPLLDGPIQPKSHPLRNGHNGEDIKRSTSVDLPSLGQEGMEYANITENSTPSSDQITAPEQTRTIGHDLKLHAPKPSLPPNNAKQRIMAVTRTDSDRAAAFGIGRPSSNDESTHVLPSNRSLKKKASTTSQLSVDLDRDDEHIPEIGQQVPMLKYAGDVQAPSPAPGAGPDKVKHHSRRTSARGNLPPGSYGLHGHGVFAVDKLEKAYYEKHPEALKKEHTPYQYDRSNDFSMSSENLNKIVRETASRGSGLGVQNYPGTPSEQVGWQAIEETTSRVASPRPISAGRKSPVKPTFAVQDDKGESRALEEDDEPKNVIHVDEPNRRSSRGKSMDGSAPAAEEDEEYTAPILAEDEVAKNPSPYAHEPAVVPERRESAEAKSRPTSRPASIYKENSFEMRSTPLEDVEEYEPLFKDDEQPAKKPEIPLRPKTEHKRRFPSADVWEDAPSSTMYTAEVSTPEPTAEQQEEDGQEQVKPQVEPREGETFAQAFARQQEELAEKEARENGPDGFVKSSTPKPSAHQQRPSWVQGQPHLLQEVKKEAAKTGRPSMAQRFPSRDVWEDSPESLQLQTEVSTPQQDEEQPEEQPEVSSAITPEISPCTEEPEPTIDAKLAAKPEVKDETPEPKEPFPTPAVVTERKPSPPAIPSRPNLPSRPSIPDRPKPKPAAKPAIPARPVKASPTSGGLEPAEAAAPPRQKPAVPARPMGSKIAALQAGFMNDLNNRLRLGPQMPVKKEEPPAEEEKAEEKEKVPLTDARKGRARGPQRRAPAAAKAAATATAAPAQAETKKEEGPKLSFSVSVSYWSIDPESEESGVTVGTAKLKGLEEDKPKEEVKSETKTEAEAEKPKLEEVKDEAKAVAQELVPEPVQEAVKEEAPKEEEPKEEKVPTPEAITSEVPGAFPSTPAIEAEVKAEAQADAEEAEAESSVAPDTPTSTEAPVQEQEPVEAEAQAEAEAETKEPETKSEETAAASTETEKVEDKREATTATEKAQAAASTPVTNSSNTGTAAPAAAATEDAAPKEEVKSLVTNTAGETIVQEHVTKDDKGGVKSLEAEDKGGEEA